MIKLIKKMSILFIVLFLAGCYEIYNPVSDKTWIEEVQKKTNVSLCTNKIKGAKQ